MYFLTFMFLVGLTELSQSRLHVVTILDFLTSIQYLEKCQYSKPYDGNWETSENDVPKVNGVYLHNCKGYNMSSWCQ